MPKVTNIDIKLVSCLLILGFGIGIQFLGAWGIDFAFLTAISGSDCTHLPVINYCANIGDWWNLNFFVFFPLGAAMMIIGGYGIGRIARGCHSLPDVVFVRRRK